MPLDFTEFQPSDETPAAIATALDAAIVRHGACARRADELQERRQGMLLTSSDRDIEAIERERAVVLRDADRLALIIPELQRRLAAARRVADGADVRRLAEDASEKAEAFLSWWDAKYRRLAPQIVAGLQLEREATMARVRLHQALARTGINLSAEGISEPRWPSVVITGTNYASQIEIGDLVTLPSMNGWPVLINGGDFLFPGHVAQTPFWDGVGQRRTKFG